ncbi:MAG: glutathione S-transferase family protein [Sedimenticola sp.]
MSDLTLVIGNQNYSSWSLRPWLFLRHHQIPFSCRKVSLFVETTAADLTPYFSDAKVPVLHDEELEVWDSLAILEYLAEHFPEKQGWPKASATRAVARAVSAEMHSSFFDLRRELPMNCRHRFPGFKPTGAAQRDIHRVQNIWRLCREMYGEEGPWLFGNFSVADCMFAPVVLRLISYEVALDDVAREYTETLYSSAAIQEWVAASKSETQVIKEDEAEWPSVAI